MFFQAWLRVLIALLAKFGAWSLPALWASAGAARSDLQRRRQGLPLLDCLNRCFDTRHYFFFALELVLLAIAN